MISKTKKALDRPTKSTINNERSYQDGTANRLKSKEVQCGRYVIASRSAYQFRQGRSTTPTWNAVLNGKNSSSVRYNRARARNYHGG